jgi:hypothetical protein
VNDTCAIDASLKQQAADERGEEEEESQPMRKTTKGAVILDDIHTREIFKKKSYQHTQ